jgi:hypothetical protein
MRKPLLLLFVLSMAWPARVGQAGAPAGVVAGQVSVIEAGLAGDRKRGGNEGVVVFLDEVPGPPPRPLPPQVMRQRDSAFVPQVLAIPRGTTVEFPNEDKIFHNAFSLSEAARFDLGLYRGGVSRRVTFQRPGVVDVYCNIHPDMVAAIRVLDTGYFAVTDHSGAFRIAGVPPGKYPLIAWAPRSPEVRRTVTITAGGTTTTKLELRVGAAIPRHTRKDGTPYGRYE